MSNQSVFQRYELKYLINSKQKSAVVDAMRSHMKEDEYGRSTICNIYFDASNYLLIRHSLDKPVYKEKLRVRSYGVARSDSPVFVELKKKYKSVVYKRRISMTEQEAMEYLCQKKHTGIQSQIGREIDYFFHFTVRFNPPYFSPMTVKPTIRSAMRTFASPSMRIFSGGITICPLNRAPMALLYLTRAVP